MCSILKLRRKTLCITSFQQKKKILIKTYKCSNVFEWILFTLLKSFFFRNMVSLSVVQLTSDKSLVLKSHHSWQGVLYISCYSKLESIMNIILSFWFFFFLTYNRGQLHSLKLNIRYWFINNSIDYHFKLHFPLNQ